MTFKTIKEFTEKYEEGYEDRELTHFEKQIFNGKKFNLSTLDLTNIDILNSLSIFYHIQSIKTGSVEQEQLYVAMILKMSKLNDRRGFSRLGCYYQQKDKQKSEEYYLKAYELGSVEAGFNLFIMQDDPLKNNKYINVLLGTLKMSRRNQDSIYLCSLYFLENDQVEGYKYLEYGIYKESTDCLNYIKEIMSITDLYMYFLHLPFTNLMIENEKSKILSGVIQEKVDDQRDSTYAIETKNGLYVLGGSVELITMYETF